MPSRTPSTLSSALSSVKAAPYPVNRHRAYHAHIYFDADSVERVREICARISGQFGLKVGRIHQKPVGPHTAWSVQIVFNNEEFDAFVPWLDSERGNLDVLVHGVTDDEYEDHTRHAYWLGQARELDLSIFTKGR